MIYNLNEIIEFKYKYPEKVELLLGNHDLQYYFDDIRKYGCSGFRPHIWAQVHEIFKLNKSIFKASYGYKNYLWTHAGISSQLSILIDKLPFDKTEWSPEINRLFYVLDETLFRAGYDRGGEHPIGSIFWAHIEETRWNIIKGLHQIVGHTPIDDILTESLDDGSITYVDCLEHGKQNFYEIDI